MKKVPFTIFPLAVVVITMILFMTVVPKDGDLISASGDDVLGQIIGVIFGVCLAVDIKNFIQKRWPNKS